MTMSFLPESIDTRLRDEIARRGLVLLELKRRGERGTAVVEVIVDAEQGVTLDELAELSRFASALFDEAEDSIPGRYRLEVSSAGLDRPLEHPWQFRKNIGRLLKLTYDGDDDVRRTDLFEVEGLVEDVLIVVPKAVKGRKSSDSVGIPLERITRAVVEPKF